MHYLISSYARLLTILFTSGLSAVLLGEERGTIEKLLETSPDGKWGVFRSAQVIDEFSADWSYTLHPIGKTNSPMIHLQLPGSVVVYPPRNPPPVKIVWSPKQSAIAIWVSHRHGEQLFVGQLAGKRNGTVRMADCLTGNAQFNHGMWDFEDFGFVTEDLLQITVGAEPDKSVKEDKEALMKTHTLRYHVLSQKLDVLSVTPE